jgi:N-succinyldiaminopimelate aminotransferase
MRRYNRRDGIRGTRVNPRLSLLQPYPFEKLRALYAGVTPDPAKRAISLSLGEPKHPTPRLIIDALDAAASAFANYPTTLGPPALREAISAWLARRHGIPPPSPGTQILPVLGSREALFSFGQTVLDGSNAGATVVVPNPFYQIYEGAAVLAGARIHCVNAGDFAGVAPEVWSRTQLLYVCSPDNPTGRVLDRAAWRELFTLSDRYGFVIASDECYSEIYFDEGKPPLGALAAAYAEGREDYARLVVFSSLSKRSNAPGLRSGFVAGDASILKSFLLYRTYHGSAMSGAVAAASTAAWKDEEHVRANRVEYAAKFGKLQPEVNAVLPCAMPEAAFYLWAQTPIDEAEFAKRLLAEENVAVLPGSYVAREANGLNPGRRRIRIALVANQDECSEAVGRLVAFTRRLSEATTPA